MTTPANVKRADQFERVVFSELLIPNTPNSYGDITSEASIRDFAYQFAIQGYGMDINHDKVDVGGVKCVVVESFIARPGDPDFIVGSWVIGVKILDDALWDDIMNGNINGFSYQADVWMQEILLENLRNRTVTGVTEPDLYDGHTHTYAVVLDPLNKPISGGTGITNGHSHNIRNATFTTATDGHRHRYQVIQKEKENAN